MVITGLDVLTSDLSRIRSRRVGLIANHTSVTGDLEYSWRRLRREGLDLRRVFAPEHGLYGTEQDQIAVQAQPDKGIEVVSLYGKDRDSLLPDPSVLEDLDLVLFDVQDVGARYYTFVNTLALFMESLQGRDIELVVLDRPNPIGGESIEGPLLSPGFESFVGVFPVPVRHGMTPGELALLYRALKGLDIRLSVVQMQGWDRRMSYSETGLPWVPPSPNMPTERTALVYPGMCLIEGTNASEGRGTTTPFELIGAGYVDADQLCSAANGLRLPGVSFRPMYFRPTFHKWANRACGGAYIHVTDPSCFRPFRTGVGLVQLLHDLYPKDFAFRSEVYEFVRDRLAFDLLTGGLSLREDIQTGAPLDRIVQWKKDEAAFAESRRRFLLY